MIYYKIRKQNTIFYFGHRGAPQIFYENTIESISKAIELGCHGVEVDIQITKDNKIILFHDDFILSNRNKKIFIIETDYKTIVQLCTEKNIPPPNMLDHLINIIKNYPQIVFNIEIKSQSFNNSKILKKIFNEIPIDILMNQCIVSSFNYFLLYQLRLLFLYKGSTAFILASKHIKGIMGIRINKALISILNPAFLHINIENVNESLVDWVHSKSMAINTYTINDSNTLKKCISLGIDGVFSDNHALYS